MRRDIEVLQTFKQESRLSILEVMLRSSVVFFFYVGPESVEGERQQSKRVFILQLITTVTDTEPVWFSSGAYAHPDQHPSANVFIEPYPRDVCVTAQTSMSSGQGMYRYMTEATSSTWGLCEGSLGLMSLSHDTVKTVKS